MEQERFVLTLNFQGRYIAHPYWPEREEIINIQKNSGMNRARSEEKRHAALIEYLRRQGNSLEEYEMLKLRAERPWYRVNDEDETSPIIISTHQLYGCLIEAAKQCPASLRPCAPDNLRHVIVLEDCITQKDKADDVYRRLVMPKSGTGQPLSNQRSLRENPYIENFAAVGAISYYRDDIRDDGEYLPDFLGYAGQRIGVGAARKMGCGRFTVKLSRS